jgi:predicted transcriptional regulator
MTQNAATKVMTAHVPTELADQIDHFAGKLDRSRAWVIKQALSAWVEHEAERARLTAEGLEDVKAGRTVEHAEVHAWAQSLGTDKPLPLPMPR